MGAILASALVYAGLLTVLSGVISLLRPRLFPKIRNRRRAALVLALGLLIATLGFAFPTQETRIAEPRTQLDQFTPVYHFSEVHSIRVRAPKDRVYRAIKEVTADEILLFRTLTWIRRLGRSGPESIMNAPEHAPLLEVATRTSFLLLAEEPDREIVVGTLVAAPPGFRPKGNPTAEDFKAIHAPGFAVAAMNFLVEEDGSSDCIVTTETRIYATDLSARQRFSVYWRVIYPGSALIRRMWLRAIKRRASESFENIRKDNGLSQVSSSQATLEVADESEARHFGENDPSVRAGLNRWELFPMHVAGWRKSLVPRLSAKLLSSLPTAQE